LLVVLLGLGVVLEFFWFLLNFWFDFLDLCWLFASLDMLLLFGRFLWGDWSFGFFFFQFKLFFGVQVRCIDWALFFYLFLLLLDCFLLLFWLRSLLWRFFFRWSLFFYCLFVFSELWLQLLSALRFSHRSNLRVFSVGRTGWSSSLGVVRGRPHSLLEIWVWQLETAWVRRIFWSFWMVWRFTPILHRLRLQIKAFDLCNTWGF
jgi:hypothetical protein